MRMTARNEIDDEMKWMIRMGREGGAERNGENDSEREDDGKVVEGE